LIDWLKMEDVPLSSVRRLALTQALKNANKEGSLEKEGDPQKREQILSQFLPNPPEFQDPEIGKKIKKAKEMIDLFDIILY